jgi:hypothetical protein
VVVLWILHLTINLVDDPTQQPFLNPKKDIDLPAC